MISTESTNPFIEQVRENATALFTIHINECKAQDNEETKRMKIAMLKREMDEATENIGKEGYRDISRIASDMKRANNQLDSVLESSENYTDNMKAQISTLITALQQLNAQFTLEESV